MMRIVFKLIGAYLILMIFVSAISFSLNYLDHYENQAENKTVAVTLKKQNTDFEQKTDKNNVVSTSEISSTSFDFKIRFSSELKREAISQTEFKENSVLYEFSLNNIESVLDQEKKRRHYTVFLKPCLFFKLNRKNHSS